MGTKYFRDKWNLDVSKRTDFKQKVWNIYSYSAPPVRCVGLDYSPFGYKEEKYNFTSVSILIVSTRNRIDSKLKVLVFGINSIPNSWYLSSSCNCTGSFY